MYEASITDHPHSAYAAPNTPASQPRAYPAEDVSGVGRGRSSISSHAITAAAAAIRATEDTYTARSICSRGKSATSSANGLDRYVPTSGRKLEPYPDCQLISQPPSARPCSTSHRWAWNGTNCVPRSFTFRFIAPNGWLPASADPRRCAHEATVAASSEAAATGRFGR